jgi:isopenicillin-N epimerase
MLAGRMAGARMTANDRWGAAVAGKWMLEPGFVSVNHGAYGATPRMVLAAQDAIRARMESQPGRFMRAELPEALRAAADILAGLLGARGADLVFVTNATEAVNAVLRSLPLAAGDEVLVLSHGYGAVRNAVRHIAARAGARMVVAALPYPRPTDAAVLAALEASLTPRTRLAVLDHVTSPSALVLPLAAMVALCHAAGVKVLADGAHAPGMLALDLPALGAEWYVGNCHKWLCAPKGAGFLWARAEAQAGLQPATISHGIDDGFAAAFDWTGTRDFSAILAVPAAVAFWQALGGLAMMARGRDLVAQAASGLAAALGTEIGTPTASPACMATIRIPLADPARAGAFAAALLEAGTDAPVHALEGAAWLRISAHAYNTEDDYHRLGAILRRILPGWM